MPPATIWPEWGPEALLWLLCALLITLVVVAAGIWVLVKRLERVQRELGALAALPEIERRVTRALAERDDLDLRRIEHLLVDLRDGSKRMESLLARAEELRASSNDALVPMVPPPLGERVLNRLLALGYERIEIVTPEDSFAAITQTGGYVLVEARREGILCKGRVRVRAGRIESVQLQPAFPVFP